MPHLMYSHIYTIRSSFFLAAHAMHLVFRRRFSALFNAVLFVTVLRLISLQLDFVEIAYSFFALWSRKIVLITVGTYVNCKINACLEPSRAG